MAIKWGPHAQTRGLKPEIICILPIVSDVYEEYGIPAIVTSGTDRSHSRGSLHYAGYAVDIYWESPHSWDDPASVRLDLYTAINGFPPAADIPPDYDVVFEGNHFHIEYQPKVPPEEYTCLVRAWLARGSEPSPVADDE